MTGPKVMLTDTTLRDGEQGCGFAMKPEDKAALARLLDEAGFYSIEAGIPAMGDCEKEAVRLIMQQRKKARISVWNRMNQEDIRHSFDCAPDIIHISAPASPLLIQNYLHRNQAWVTDTLQGCVELARGRGYEVTVGFQDASRADMGFMIALANRIKPLGVSSIRLADTVGILTPLRARQMASEFAKQTGMPFGIHPHNDLGMATAVAFEAVKGGASFVDTTLFGIGERAGNCDSHNFTLLAEGHLDLLSMRADLEAILPQAEGILFPSLKERVWR
ncbi:MAG TPA: homocitrate synthase [Syntrophomonas sp.]|nr:homocitrate synthase [Syntrophomonas sp.]